MVIDVMWKCKAMSLFCHFCGAAIFISGLPSIYPFFSLPDSMRSVGWNVVRHAPLDLNTGASPKQTDKSGIQELRHSFCPALSITVFLMCLDFDSNIYRLLLLSIIYDASSVSKNKRLQTVNNSHPLSTCHFEEGIFLAQGLTFNGFHVFFVLL